MSHWAILRTDVVVQDYEILDNAIKEMCKEHGFTYTRVGNVWRISGDFGVVELGVKDGVLHIGGYDFSTYTFMEEYLNDVKKWYTAISFMKTLEELGYAVDVNVESGEVVINAEAL